MKKHFVKRIISALLSVTLISSVFIGCNADNKDDENNITAAPVVFNSKGAYTATVTSDKVKLSGVTADKVSVTYDVFDEAGYKKAVKAATSSEDVNEDDYYTESQAKVTEVKEEDGKLSVSFTDDKADELATDYYLIHLDNPKTSVMLNVKEDELKLQPNVASVSANDKTVRLTLELNKGEFKDEVKPEDITLYGSFEKLKLESLSSAGKNLTMQLSGDINKTEFSNAYSDGFVDVDRAVVTNALRKLTASIPVTTQDIYFDPSTLAMDGENVKLVMQVCNTDMLSKLTEKDIAFEKDTTVTKCEKISDDKAQLTLKIKNAKDINSAAKILNGQKVKVGDKTVSADFSEVSFYPVFDFVEEKDGDLNFTLLLYASSGNFSDLKEDMVTLKDDFKDGKISSLSKSSDTAAELKISVPANGQTADSLDMYGTVALSAEALVNRWNEKRSESDSYSRSYSQESMGRDLNVEDINAIKNIVGGFGNTKIGTIAGIGSGLSAGITIADGLKTLLETLGVIEGVDSKLDKISGMIESMQKDLEQIKDMLDKQNQDKLKDDLDEFFANLSTLNRRNGRLKALYLDAAKALKSTDSKFKTPSIDESKEDWDAYYKKVISKAKEIDHSRYTSLIEQYDVIIDSLIAPNTTSILDTYDQYMTYVYNFDTSSERDRDYFRTVVQGALVDAATTLGMYYAYSEPTPMDESYKLDIIDELGKVQDHFKEKEVKPRTDLKIYCYTIGQTFKEELIASNRLSSTSGTHRAVAKGDINYYTDTAGKGELSYYPSFGDSKVYLFQGGVGTQLLYQDGDSSKGPSVISTDMVTPKKNRNKILVNKKAENGSYPYAYEGLADTYTDDNGINIAKSSVEKYLERTNAMYKGNLVEELLRAGFVVPNKLHHRYDDVSYHTFEGIPYYYTKKNHWYYYADVMGSNGKIKENEYIGMSGKHNADYCLHFVMA